MNSKIKQTEYYYIFEEDKKNDLFLNRVKAKYSTFSLLHYIKKRSDDYFKSFLLEYGKKYNYKKIKMCLISTIIMKEKKIDKLIVRIMIGQQKNIPNAYICGNDRFFEISLIQKEQKFDYKENILLIEDYFQSFSNRNINLKILIRNSYIRKNNNKFFNFNIFGRINIIGYNQKFSKCSGNEIKNHYETFKMIFNRLLENGLLEENKSYVVSCYYYQSLLNEEKFELSVKTIDQSGSCEKWSSCYKINDFEKIYDVLSECKMIDKVIKDYDIFKISNEDLKDVINYSKTILY